MSKDDKKRPGDDAKSRRELLAATAKLSAFFAAVGLAGTGLGGGAAAEEVMLKRGIPTKRALPAVRKQELKLLLNDALRTGDARGALARRKNLQLSPRQQSALMQISKQEWAAMRSAQAKMRAFDDLAAGDTGYVFW
jgi:hypothetical protein